MKKRAASNRGWWDVALDIWQDRPHRCEVCNVFLGDEPRPEFFSHLLPRGSYPSLKRSIYNIRLKCFLHHEEWHSFGDKDKLIAHDPRWQDIVDLYIFLRNEANGVQ